MLRTTDRPRQEAARAFRHFDKRITEAQCRQVVDAFFDEAIKHLLNGGKVILPHSLGEFTVEYSEPEVVVNDDYTIDYQKSRFPIDWPTTYKRQAEGKRGLAYYHNEHTDFKIVNLHWKRPKRWSFYRFTPSHHLTKRLSKHIIDNPSVINNYSRKKQ